MRVLDLTGQKFHRWTVIARADNSKKGQARWRCRCDCGTESVLISVSIRNGHSKSCGCFKSEATSKRFTVHGHSVGGVLTPTYNTWVGMVNRCTSQTHKAFASYGGSGISIDPKWLVFATFLEDMGEKPPGTSLDRVDNSGNYCKENCRWATATQQARNKSNNTLIEAFGKAMPISAWSELLGLRQSTISWRINNGCTPEQALSTTRLKRGSTKRSP